MRIIYFLLPVLYLSLSCSCQRKTGEGTKTAKTPTESPEDIFKRGTTKLHSGDNEGAIVEFNKALELDRKYTDAYYWRAVAKCYLNDKVGCCEDYTKAQKLGHPSAAEMLELYCK